MSEEELKKVKEIIERLFAGTGVTIGDIVDTAPWLDKLVNEVERLQKDNYNLDRENQHFFDRIQDLQKENEELKFFAESYRKQIKLMQEEYKKGDFIHKGFIRDKIEEMQIEKINGLHKTYIAEEVLKELLEKD